LRNERVSKKERTKRERYTYNCPLQLFLVGGGKARETLQTNMGGGKVWKRQGGIQFWGKVRRKDEELFHS